MHFQENTLYDLDLVVKVTQNVVQCPPNHMTYAPAKFEVATSNSLGEEVNYMTLTLESRSQKGYQVPSISCDLCTCKL